MESGFRKADIFNTALICTDYRSESGDLFCYDRSHEKVCPRKNRCFIPAA